MTYFIWLLPIIDDAGVKHLITCKSYMDAIKIQTAVFSTHLKTERLEECL